MIARWTGHRGNLGEPCAQSTTGTAGADGHATAAAPAGHALADRAVAIEHIGGNVDIYREVIASFLADQVGTAGKLRALLAAADIATAHRIAHTLKGTAATIGATGLFDAALALDRDLKAGTLPRDWPVRMDTLEARLGATLAAIQAELSSSSGG